MNIKMVEILGIVLQFLERHTIVQGLVLFEWVVKYLHVTKSSNTINSDIKSINERNSF